MKLGFVGAGFMGQAAHLVNYAALAVKGACEITALAEPRQDLAREVARRYRIPNVYSNHRQMLENCDVDAVVAIQRYEHHLVVIPDILEAGKPVLTEKPVALSIEAGQKLAEQAASKGLLYMVGYHKRSDPAMEYAKGVIDKWKTSGEYGRMRYVRITMPPGDWKCGIEAGVDTIIAGTGAAYRYEDGEMEPGVPYYDEKGAALYSRFVNYYIHQINALRFIFGGNYKVTYADKSGVLLAAESESGVCGTIEMAPYNTCFDWQETIMVGFEQAYIKVELPPPLIRHLAGTVEIMTSIVKTRTQSVYSPSMPPLSAMSRQAENYIAALKGERTAPCTAAEAVEDLKTAKQYIDMLLQK